MYILEIDFTVSRSSYWQGMERTIFNPGVVFQLKATKQQVDNLEGVQRCCKEPCALCLCPNNCFDEVVSITWTFKAGIRREGQVVRKAMVLLPSSNTDYVPWPGVIEICSLQRYEPRLILVSSGLGL